MGPGLHDTSRPQGTAAGESRRQPIRLPNFAGQKEIGLGDVISRATSSVHLKPCGGCARRAELLNRWVVFSPRRPG